MREKKLYLHLCDEEYGKRLLRYLNSHRHSGLRVEMMTEREPFWEGRRQGQEPGAYWLTDDVTGSLADPGDPSSLWILSERTDERRHRISYVRKADELIRELMAVMELDAPAEGPSGAAPSGIYGIYSPGEEGSVTAALLSQALGELEACTYINLREFPLFYTVEPSEERGNLGELFFRLECENYKELVTRYQITYGKATRLPTVSHYRDLWDIGEEDREHFFRRLLEDCGCTYVVVLFNDIREAIPMMSRITGFFTVSRKGSEESIIRCLKRYVRNENIEESEIGKTVVMPDGWTEWIRDMESQSPENWLREDDRQRFIRSLWEEVSG